MLNLPGSEETDAAARPQSPRHLLRRRPLSGGDRLRGWADVREIHATPQEDGDACVTKYHVDLNLTAHLDWDAWQRLCAAEPLQTDAPTLCMLSTTLATPNPASDAEEDNEEEGHTVAHSDAERRHITQGAGERHAGASSSAPRAS